MSNKHRIAGRILIFGGGGHAREIECLAKDIFAAHAGGEVVAFVERDDSPQLGSFMHGVPIITSSEAVRRFGDVPFVVAIGDPRVRQEVTGHALASGLIPTILVHPSVVMSETVMLGPGTVVCAGCIFTCDIKVGAHVHVNRASLISHDVTIGDYATLALACVFRATFGSVPLHFWESEPPSWTVRANAS